MKKLITLVMVLCMCAVGFGAVDLEKVYINRHPFNIQTYFVWQPADSTGTYWSRWTLNCPTGIHTESFSLGEMFYGVPKEGKYQTATDGSRSGSWGGESTTSGWVYRAATAQNSYIEWTIPANHNRIHLFLYHNGAIFYPATASITLDGATTNLDTTSISVTGNSDYVEEFILATGASDGTTRTLKVNNDTDGKWIGVLGIHSFDDDALGDISTVSAGTLALGHDFVDQYDDDINTDPSTARGKFTNLEVAGQAKKIVKTNTIEFTMNWSPDGEAGKWTGYGAHYAAADAQFEVSDNAELVVDGTAVGDMSSLVSVPYSTILEADTITTRVVGWADYDGDDAANDGQVITIYQNFTNNGVGITASVVWSAASDITNAIGAAGGSALYVPSLSHDDGQTGNVLRYPQTTEYPLGDDFKFFGVNSVDFVSTDGCTVRVSGGGPQRTYFSGPTYNATSPNKVYGQLDVDSLFGGTDPSNQTWIFSGLIQTMKTGASSGGGSGGGGGGYRSRYSN